MKKRIPSLIMTIVLLVCTMQAAAQPAPQEVGTRKNVSRLEIQQILTGLADSSDLPTIRKHRAEASQYAAEFRERITLVESEINQLNLALEGIAVDKKDEQTVANEALSGLVGQKHQKELELAELRLLLLTSEEVINQLDAYIRARERQGLLDRQPVAWKLSADSDPATGGPTRFLYRDDIQPHWVVLVLSILAAFVVLVSMSAKSMSFLEKSGPRNMVHLVSSRVKRRPRIYQAFLLLLCVSVSFNVLLSQDVHQSGITEKAILLLFLFLLGSTFLQSSIVKFSRTSDEHPVHDNRSKAVRLPVFAFSLLTAIGYLGLPDTWSAFLQPPVGMLLHLLWLYLWMASAYFLARSTLLATRVEYWKVIRPPVLLIIMICIILDLIGYRSLTRYCLSTAVYSLAVLGIAMMLYDAVELFSGLFAELKERIIKHLNLPSPRGKQPIQAQVILRVGMRVLVVVGAVLVIFNLWVHTSFDVASLGRLFTDGFQVSGVTIAPLRIFTALLFFAICWPAVSHLVQIIDRRWLVKAELPRSSRDTVTTLIGYACYALVILFLLGVLGVRMTGLAVIVGALSVGIGFGLQNVVNNFISGLILMFERPIKVGDWVQVGTTEGYVKKISIRSTIVQTFDRSDVIVPNSELISSQVTNMMYDDKRGRLRVSIGVAYGSDTALVQRLLLEAANNHQLIVSDGTSPQPRVLFQSFGDSSLNFDLLCHVEEVDEKIQVRSDLHLAIDRLFRENRVEIPFPQRDVHIKQPETAGQ